MALKSDDWNAVLGCHSCHTLLDGPESELPGFYDALFGAALRRTRSYWARQGLADER